MKYHAERGQEVVSDLRRYDWRLTAAENRLMMRLRGLGDGLHLMTVRKVGGEVEAVGVMSAAEEKVNG